MLKDIKKPLQLDRKTPILGGEADIQKVLVSNKICFGEKRR